MNDAGYWSIFLNAALINNFVLAYFLGICPFFGVSAKIETAIRMSGAVSFVMLVASACAFGINLVLEAINAPYLRIISYILVISSTVQLVEMLMRKLSPPTFRALGIFLPLITTNCAILGLALFQTNKGYGFACARNSTSRTYPNSSRERRPHWSWQVFYPWASWDSRGWGDERYLKRYHCNSHYRRDDRVSNCRVRERRKGPVESRVR